MNQHLRGHRGFNEQDCRQALLGHLRCSSRVKSCLAGLFQKFCIKADSFVIYKVENFLTYRVTLESVLERRTDNGFEELSLDGTNASVQQWSGKFPIEGREFESCEYILHKKSADKLIRLCSQCNGTGLQDCKDCNARGNIECDCLEDLCQPPLPSESIYGSAPCELCNGCAYCYRCIGCEGRRRIQCRQCGGIGETYQVQTERVKRYVLHDREMVDLPNGLPESKALRAEGIPERHWGMSAKLVEARLRRRHNDEQMRTGRVMTDQRLTIHQVPVARAHYECNNGKKKGCFWVLGVSGDFCHCPMPLPMAAHCS